MRVVPVLKVSFAPQKESLISETVRSQGQVQNACRNVCTSDNQGQVQNARRNACTPVKDRLKMPAGMSVHQSRTGSKCLQECLYIRQSRTGKKCLQKCLYINQGQVQNACRNVCMSNIVASPDPLSPAFSNSSAMKTPENKEKDTDAPELEIPIITCNNFIT
jgi:hypothetical protein